MASPVAKNYTIGTVTAIFFISLAVFFDAVKIILFFIDAIPLVGPPIGVLGSWFDAILELICVNLGLYLAGAYKGKNAMTGWIMTMGLAMIDLVPILNDFPSTTIAVIVLVIRSRANDKLTQLEHTKKNIVSAKHIQEQSLKERAAYHAKRRANENRQRAMETSIDAAQAPT